ncbi:amiloride-sensitive sodium channel subunit beta-like isoform X2 [Patiria miniata]|uniref:Uncharacterized protein n=1 Tax=Patiria miniata TaxID=46514 RepID=A0A914BQ57_PATMI|nr:amiloride-sensitive sodium channel subunit beta-like isoform X2 [Patiria miniata]
MYHSESGTCPPVRGGLSKRKVSPMTAEELSIDDGRATGPDQPQAPDAEQTGLLYVVSHRLAESGAHGIPNIQRANSTCRRLVWTVLFLAGFGMFIYQGTVLVIKYYSYPINVNIEVRTPKKVQFPAVTWCNLNPIRKDALRDYADLNSLLEGSNPECTTSSGNSSFQGYPSDWDSADIDYSAEDCDRQTFDSATDIVGAMPYSERSKTGHHLNDMLLKCTFQEKPCSPKNFSTIYNSRYGNCYTFNSGFKGVEAINVTKVGPTYGLSMELYIQQDLYITGVETGAGVRIMVHNQTDMPFPEDKGANVAPGTESFIGIFRVMVNRLPLPYGDCADHFVKDNIFKNQFGHLEYTKTACEKDCYFKEVLEQCKCADVQYRYDDSIAACNSSIESEENCIDEIQQNFTSGVLDCTHCHKSCNETRFERSFSHSIWPNHDYKDTVKENIQKSNKDTVDLMRNNSAFIEENVLRVNVYYDSLFYDDIYQSEAYPSSSLASDLGGQVGLWIGVSVLTVFEFVELMMDVCVLAMSKCRAGGEKGRAGKSSEHGKGKPAA